ncbi:MAG: hydrogenase formation protein HypD [Desulfobacterales bacterium]|nr:hydrogenase formation protein HypD [Desulfobacterales bacterium]
MKSDPVDVDYGSAFRDRELARRLIDRIARGVSGPLNLMEVCGTHTMAIFRHGIRSVLPREVRLMSGPGCPVCVTSQGEIDAFVALARDPSVIVTTFGDLMRVPGSGSSLAGEKARGADVRMVYSIFDALDIAQAHPDREVVFCGVGFETTIPTIAAGILTAGARKLKNFSVLAAHKLTPPALGALMETQGVGLDGFMLPGHVSVITGTRAYEPVVEKYGIPSVIAGFEPLDILRAVLRLVLLVAEGGPALENAYPRAVAKEGNPKARAVMDQVFQVGDAVWRGIGMIPQSGMAIRPALAAFDAGVKFGLSIQEVPEPRGCACGEILMGLKTPEACPLYKKKCTPLNPVGPCMVSSEGACAAFYRYG